MEYKLLSILKQDIKMSMCIILENENDFYIASDTRAIDIYGNIIEETRQKIVPFKTLPLIIVATGISSFTKSNINLKDYISMIENNIDTTKDIYENIDFINNQLKKGINECLENCKEPINAAMEVYYLYYNGKEIIPIYCIINNGTIITEYILQMLNQKYPKQVHNIKKIGNDDIDYLFKREMEEYNLNSGNFHNSMKDFFDLCNKEYKRIGLNYINNSLDVLKVSPNGYSWLEKNSI